ncbi:hypothetical protein ACFLS9_00510 [Bacteroidota bacterium]
MNPGKLTLAALVGGITMWLLAGLWHEFIAVRFYAEKTDATHEGTVIIFIAYIVLAILMAYMFSLGHKKGKRPAIEGLRFGILIGILWVFPHDLAMAGAHGESISYVFKNTAWHIVEQGVGGIIVALVFAKFQKKQVVL